MNFSLNGAWQFRKTTDSLWKDATVPGCNFTDLLSLGKIPDPFLKLNEQKVQWVGLVDWEYRKKITLTKKQLDCNKAYLCFDCLDSICSVRINGVKLPDSKNVFLPYKASCLEYLHEGENEIYLLFKSPVKWVKQMYEKCETPPNANGQNGIVHIRKPQYHFGWDWGPVLPCSGVMGQAYFDFVQGAEIRDIDINYTLENNEAFVSVDTDIEDYSAFECVVEIQCPDGKKLTCNNKKADFTIENPELWWTYELNPKDKQSLYTVKATLYDKKKIVSEMSKTIGFRTLKLRQEKDSFGTSFQFVLNGVPLFAKGADMIPADSFVNRVGEKELEKLLAALRFSNMNMVRIWGGGYYGDDKLYSRLDEMGILAWQDFMFACQAYPFFDDEFTENVLLEVASNVKRIKSHPSLALWCGNNEIEDMHFGWLNMPEYIRWTEKFFYHILPDELRRYDNTTPYIPSSPFGTAHNKNVTCDNVGDTHIWAVWHGLKDMKYYRKRMTRFCSEFGFESLPDKKTVRSFGVTDDFNISDEKFNSHQKCLNGNDKMMYYTATRFGLPQKDKNLIYLSQLTQSECISDATEHWRRNRHRCFGSLYWQLNDCWPVCSWSSMDYYGGYKALQYHARHFNAPQSVCVEDTENAVKVFVINDLNCTEKFDVRYELFGFSRGTLEGFTVKVLMKPFSSKCVITKSLDEIKRRYNLKATGIAVTLIKNGEELNRRIYLFDKEKNLSLPKARLDYRVECDNEKLTIFVSSDTFARDVCLYSDISFEPFSDNFFDLLPKEKRVITMNTAENDAEKIAKSISVFSLSDIEMKNDNRAEIINKIKIWTSPVNLANAIGHAFKPKDSKE